jgi:hypothetical protein
MDRLTDIISDARIFLYGGLRTLPLTLAGTLLILGLFTANYAILFFLIGFLVLTPFLAIVLNGIFSSILEYMNIAAFKTKTADICRVILPYTTLQNPVGMREENVVFSTWMAMVAFFVGYLFTNGLELLDRKAPTTNGPPSSEMEAKVSARKTQAMLAIGSVLVFGLLVILFRRYSGCENMYSIILTFLVFMYAGQGWYKMLASVGEDRLSDLFGIANRLLPSSATENGPIACVPMKV